MSDPIQFDSRSVRHDLPFLHPAQAQKEHLVNEALARLEALTQPVVQGSLPEPPAAPQPGDAYIVAQGASGPWEGHSDAIAVWQGDQWLLQPAAEGTLTFRKDTQSYAVFKQGWKVASPQTEPSGGTTIDPEARAAIGDLCNTLRSIGILPST